MKIKKLLAIVLSVAMLISCVGFIACASEDEVDENKIYLEDGQKVMNASASADGKTENEGTAAMPVAVKAKAAILMDATTGDILMKMNEHDRLYPASVTKIMTLLLVAESIDNGKISLNDTITASANSSSKGGSQIWLKDGETMTVDELLKATAVYSANDACTALGEFVSGSEEAFIALCNQRAKELGMNDTHFDNCTGLDDTTTTHLTSAYDIAVMSRELVKHEIVLNYTTIWMDALRGGKTELVNTNKLVRFYKGATGLKTGTTAKAGCCLSATALREDTHLIAVVLGCGNSDDRFEGAKAMLNWGFSNYQTVTPTIDKSLITDVSVIKGVDEKISPELPKIDALLVARGRQDDLKQTVELAVDVQAPVDKGQVLGKVTMTLDGKEVGKYELIAPNEIAKLTFGVVFRRMLTALCK